MTTTQSKETWFSTILSGYRPSDYWDRDAGLFYRGFRALGLNSRLVCFGNTFENQSEDLILASQADLERPEWWANHRPDGVVLYSWALPRFTSVAAAIKATGARLVIVLDTGGYISPRVWPWMYFRLKRITEKQQHPVLPGLRALVKTGVASLKVRHGGLIRHLQYADWILLPSTIARQRYDRFLISWGRPDLAARLRVVPHPVSEKMIFDPGVPKEKQIIAVGGWHRLQKNTPALVETLRRVLEHASDYRARVIGPGTEYVEKLVSALAAPVRQRIKISAALPNDQLPPHYQRSRISFCSSYYESFHIPTGEALCCGCSFVGDARISPMAYFASLGCGTLSCDGAIHHFADALFAEIELWNSGLRTPTQISKTWTGQLHPQKVAQKVLDLF